MSVMDKLKAIRGRISAQTAEFEAAQADRSAGHPAENDFWYDGAAPPGATEAGRSPANMWDLAADPDATENEPTAPESARAPAPKLVPFPAPTQSPPPAAAAPVPEPEMPARPASPSTAEAAAAPRAKPAAPSDAQDQGRRGGRVKTRLLGFEHANGHETEIFEKPGEAAASPVGVRYPVGWLVVVDGPGRGASFPLAGGVSQIGRGEDQAVQLDYGDSTISRANHAAVAFDEETRGFFIGHGGKSNLVRLNGKPLLSTEAVKHGDEILVGETTLRLVALCGEAFFWAERADKPNAVNG
ncbi:MAG: FHA domain-containing protein [Paracoccaceae bacterium]|nr:FHA domain-containing protein [Paracoccaceae bacterium]